MAFTHGDVIVVPCFNEADRFDETPFLQLVHDDRVSLVMVNDGSTDCTSALLYALASESESIEVLDLPMNRGKGEAVRRGLLHAMDAEAELVGYYDADAATPPAELLRLLDALERDPKLSAVLGARVARLGSDIHRSMLRHYGGRVYATLASIALGIDVYDTQCGTKVFRNCPALRQALARPFPSKWAFDVWLIHRLIHEPQGVRPLALSAFLEVPLDAWRDVGGSKMRPGDALTALAEIIRLLVERLRNQ